MSEMTFNSDLGTEAAVFGYALLTGVALGVYYDLYRILRRIFRWGYAMIVAQDILFWVTGAIGVFFSSMIATGGRLRIFYVLTALAGWGIYALTLGRLLMKLVDGVVRIVGGILSLLNRMLIRPLVSRIRGVAKRFCAGFREKFSRITINLRKKREKIP